ncbi:fibrinogen-like protein 1-like protein [Heptranchias perlo]|uniref:fibrinogen-like protein 1-like protein n=1 Tax=Heptranchias perlo TaxID=212740 RepID=UPI00355A359F
MFSHGTLCFLVLAVFAVEKCSASVFYNLLNKTANIDKLTDEQKLRILNVNPHTNGKVHLHRDCRALNRFENKTSGIYIIQPKDSHPLAVYCDMETANGGWIVLQNVSRNGRTSFAEPWSTYQHTFGDMETDHWLGNEYIHLITQQAHYEVKFIIQSESERVEIDYASFNIESEANKYTLRLGSPIGESAFHDYLTKDGSSDNMMFSTKDEDNDRDPTQNCADISGGGWWFNHCSSVMLNSINQIHWPGICDNCKSATILIKPSAENCK